ncbi:MAG: hypothetical protein RL385_5971 [Pseudomonadota bacterium]
MSFADLVERCSLRVPVLSQEAWAQALEATLLALGEMLPQNAASAVLALLPAHTQVTLSGPCDDELGRFYARVTEHLGIDHAGAAERAQLALSVLADELDPELRRRVRRELPEPLADLLTPHHFTEPPPVHAAFGQSLSEGRPGSRTPLSSAAPGSHHPLSTAAPRGAQQHSPAASDRPHSDTTLAGSRGLTQEREGETLADSKRRGR